MKNHTPTPILATLLACALAASCHPAESDLAANTGYRIIPRPQEMAYTEGSTVIPEKVSVAFPDEFASEASMLKDYLAEDNDVSAILKAGKESGRIILKKDSALDSIPGQYRIITDGNIEISAADAKGIFYGIQSLRQMIINDTTASVLAVRNGEINDWPAFQWRSFLLDDARNFRGMKNVKIFLDEMARLKMNIFHWHLTDDPGWRIEIKKYPLLTEVGSKRDSTQLEWRGKEYDPNPHGGFYSQEQIKEVLAYAKERHITVMPEIEMPGHSSAAIASYPWLGTVGKQIKVPCYFSAEAVDMLNVTDPKVIAFLHDVLDEVMDLFPSPVIHIGGDEATFDVWKDSPAIRKYMKEHNIKTLSDVQLDFTNRMSDYIASKGRKMMGWSDIGRNPHEKVIGVADSGGQLKEGTIIQFWMGDISQIKDAAERGYDIVNSCNMCSYLDYDYNRLPLENSYNFDPIPADLPEGLHSKIIGCGAQLWTEWIRTDEKMFYQAFPRIAAIAEAGWTESNNKDYGIFMENLHGLLEVWDANGIGYGPAEDTSRTSEY